MTMILQAAVFASFTTKSNVEKNRKRMVRFEDVKTEKHFGLFIDEFWIIWIPVKYQFNQVSYRSKFNTSQNIYLLLIVMIF